MQFTSSVRVTENNVDYVTNLLTLSTEAVTPFSDQNSDGWVVNTQAPAAATGDVTAQIRIGSGILNY